MASSFSDFFQAATGHEPFDYQRRLATEVCADGPKSLAINVPTGAGKTAAAVLAWLWNRCGHPEAERRKRWPRRLVYCLPMRVLVEQTHREVSKWLARLGANKEIYVGAHVLMGGEEDGGWDLYPERDAVIIGTQDMLLSRALNRGYGMSRYRWPMHFGLLNSDCLWVIDEVQLMGSGLATTTQLQAFRRQLGTLGSVRTFWMSATVEREWLGTVDFDVTSDVEDILTLDPVTLPPGELRTRMEASKPIGRTDEAIGDAKQLAGRIVSAHRTGTRTLVVVNTVKRAVDLYQAVKKLKPQAALVLVHSRFRPSDRQKAVDALLALPGPEGTIAISTQVIEAGVDVSAATLFTDLAPWPSLVQRFGRCNRAGHDADAKVFWIDLPEDEKQRAKLAPPYDLQSLIAARETLQQCGEGVGPVALPKVEMPLAHKQVIRRKDLVELFDTTPDLAGHDIDVSRFIRETSDHDVQVFWREVPEAGPADDEPAPRREELCSVPIAEMRDLIKKKVDAWTWHSLGESWAPISAATPVYPGLTVMLRASDGRYTEREGWAPRSKTRVSVVVPDTGVPARGYTGDWMSEKAWMTLAEHTGRVVAMTADLADALGLPEPWRSKLLEAARWHDAGKAHPLFQRSMRGNDPAAPPGILAKTALRRVRHERRGFRHELASGLLALMHGQEDLVAYLAASHHGKVRLSIRSLPTETNPPEPGRRFARGIWDSELIPDAGTDVDLGGGVNMPATAIDLSFMELGDGPRGPSWLARTLAQRDRPDLGPFRLALLEALLKAADERASGAGQ